MDFFRRRWAGTLLLVALIAAFFASREQTRVETAKVRTKAIQVCAATGQAQALVLRFKKEVALQADQRGDPKAGDKFRRLARGGLLVIPLPADSQKYRGHLTDVVREGNHYALTAKSIALIERGCAESYNPN